MLRRSAVIASVVVLLSGTVGWAQSPPAPTAPTAAAPAKAVAKKPAVKGKTKPRESTDVGPCRIGVIAATGIEFGVQQVGFTVFNNEYTPVPVNSWGLDDLIVSRVKAAATGGSVRKIPYTREDLARIKESRSLFRDENAEWKEFVQRSAGSSGCDRYVLVQGYGSQFSNTNQRVEGLGIVRWGNPFKSRVFLFALTFIRIYDGQTFELVARAAAAPEDEPIVSRLLLLKPIGGPHRELDEDSFPAVATEAASNPVYREGLRTLLTSSLDRTLPAMLRQ